MNVIVLKHCSAFAFVRVCFRFGMPFIRFAILLHVRFLSVLRPLHIASVCFAFAFLLLLPLYICAIAFEVALHALCVRFAFRSAFRFTITSHFHGVRSAFASHSRVCIVSALRSLHLLLFLRSVFLSFREECALHYFTSRLLYVRIDSFSLSLFLLCIRFEFCVNVALLCAHNSSSYQSYLQV
jgi:hypothetical protein